MKELKKNLPPVTKDSLGEHEKGTHWYFCMCMASICAEYVVKYI